MLKELLKNKEFLKIIRESLKELEIIDIILFGSIVRGREKPRDIDLLILYVPKTEKIIEKSYRIRKKLEKISKNIHVTSQRYDEVFSLEFLAREAILSEGFSMRNKEFISESLGYSNFVLFRYSLKKLNKSKRMQFYYSLYGRDKTGVLEKNKCYKFSDRVILSPIENSETIKDFLDIWKIKYIEFPIIIPKRVVKYLLREKN